MATANTQPSNTADGSREVLISADSHVMEAADFMEKRLPDNLRSRAPRFPEERIGERHQAHAGGRDRNERVGEMEIDGLSAEVLYPSYPMKLYSLGRQDADLQEACFRAYNDWLVEYCQAAPDRLIGIGMISAYDIESAVLETQRCKQLGMGGVMIWQCPPEELPFASSYYDPFWQVAEELRMPVSIHSLTGIGEGARRFPGRSVDREGVDRYRGRNYSQLDVANTLFEIIFSGALHRFPQLRVVLVENEIGWIPFTLQGWDRSVEKFAANTTLSIDRPPSEYFNRQVYATFFNDDVGGKMLSWWGKDNFMWSNDYPHPNSTWPHSKEAIGRTLGHLNDEDREKVLTSNVARLYDIDVSRLA